MRSSLASRLICCWVNRCVCNGQARSPLPEANAPNQVSNVLRAAFASLGGTPGGGVFEALGDAEPSVGSVASAWASGSESRRRSTVAALVVATTGDGEHQGDDEKSGTHGRDGIPSVLCACSGVPRLGQ